MSFRCAFILLLVCLSGCGGGDQCLPGQRDCACTALGACRDGLDCHQNMCVRPREVTVQVLSSDARACEFVVVDGATQLTSVCGASATAMHRVRWIRPAFDTA